MIRDAARMGAGIAVLSQALVEEDLRSGALVQVLEEFPVAPYWMKLMVPRMKMTRPAVRTLIAFLRESMPPLVQQVEYRVWRRPAN